MNRRTFRLGPATVLAMAAGIVVLYVRWPAMRSEAEQERAVTTLRAEVARRPARKPPAPRNLDTLWERRAALRLSGPQELALAKLREKETIRITTLRLAVEAQSQGMATWLQAHQTGTSLSEIQQHAAGYSAASAALSQARQAFWWRGLGLLTEPQRARLSKFTESPS